LHFASELRQGNASGQSGVGLVYAYGRGVPQDDAEAVRWYRLAAGQGYAPSETDLGIAYALGRGVPRDYDAALRYFRLGAKQRYAKAQTDLGLMYLHGRGLPADIIEARKWFVLATAGGDLTGANNLDKLAQLMNSGQIAESDRRARDWNPEQ
jgi:TPR repeat protein